MNNLISIVIPLYNKEKSIAKTINSILEQTYTNWELIVVDDGSSDGSADVVNSFSDNRIFYFKKENGGVSSARNYGVNMAKGEWIIFIDADDYFLPHALSVLSSCVIEYKCNVAVGNFYIEDSDGRKLFKTTSNGIVKNPFREWFYYRLHPRTGNTLLNRRIFTNISYNVNLKRWEDAEFCFKLLESNEVSYISNPVMVYTNDFKGLSNPSDNIDCDFVNHLQFSGKTFWYKMCQIVILANALNRYDNLKWYLIKKYLKYSYLLFLKKLFKYIKY